MEQTQYANLVRYVPSGAYYARFKVSGKIINRSLKADRVTIARQRLGDRIKEERKKAASAETRTRGRMTVGQAIEIYPARDNENPSLQPRTKEYHRARILGIKGLWTELERKDAAKASANECRSFQPPLTIIRWRFGGKRFPALAGPYRMRGGRRQPVRSRPLW